MSSFLTSCKVFDDGRTCQTALALAENVHGEWRYVLVHDYDARDSHAQHDQYVFSWLATSQAGRILLYAQLDEMAADPELKIDWDDVRHIKWLCDAIGQPIEPVPSKYEGFRNPKI